MLFDEQSIMRRLIYWYRGQLVNLIAGQQAITEESPMVENALLKIPHETPAPKWCLPRGHNALPDLDPINSPVPVIMIFNAQIFLTANAMP